MVKNEISKSKKIILFALLIILNIILRIPSIPHEKGADSFFIHSLANSITYFGYANWWVHWLSVFGYYPYSYASAIPFSLSGVSQLTGIEMEETILLYCIILGFLGMFSAYLLAGVLYNDFLFKYLMALIYSISPCVMFFTTWEISSRGPFIIFLPFIIYIIMKNMQYAKHILLLLFTGVFFFSIHHFAIILFPMILILIPIKLLSKIEIFKSKSTYFNYMYIIGLLAVLMSPFFGVIEVTGSRYGWFTDIIITVVRYIGPLVVFASGGFVYLITKKDKKINIWYFLGITFVLVPFIHDKIYGIYLVQLYIVFFIAVGFRSVFNIRNTNMSKITGLFIIAIVISATMFSCFYNHYRTGQFKDSWYMGERTYTTGNWINDNISKEKKLKFISENHYNVRCIALQKNNSSIFIGGTEGLTYGFIEKSDIKNLDKVPITDSSFYSESPYRMTERDKDTQFDWYLENKDIRTIKQYYELDYIVQSLSYIRPVGFIGSENEKIFSDGILEIYDLRSM